MLIQGKLLGYGDDLAEVLNIRRKVFIEELGLSEDQESDEFDDIAMHAIIFEENQDWKYDNIEGRKKTVATGRIIYDGSVCKIDKVAVLKDYRGKKYGDFTVKMLLSKAFTSGINEVIAKTFSESKDFFRTIGFKDYKDEYSENGVHYSEMILKQEDLIKLCSNCN